MIQCETDDFLMSADSVEVTLPDGTTLGDQDYFNVSLVPETALGNELWIEGRRKSQPQVNEEELYIVRLILISPDKDWRTSASYAWKLDSAWMSSPGEPPSPAEESPYPSSWLHWNVESYTNSVIQVNDSNHIWECDELVLNFRPIRETRTTAQYPNQLATNKERVILKGLRLGLLFNRSVVHPETDYFSPCEKSRPCVVVDGVVQERTGGKQRDAISLGTSSTSGREWKVGTQVVALLAVLVVAALFVLTVVCHRRYHQSKLYRKLTPAPNDDLTLKEEDSYQNTTHSEFT